VQEFCSSNATEELIKTQAALKPLDSRFAQVVAENQALQTENKQLQTELIQNKQPSSRSRVLIRDSTVETNDLKTELAFFF